MKICIVSDSHDRADALVTAVREAAARGAAAVIHCGDLIGTHTVRPAMGVGLPIHLIHGNNLGDPAALARLARDSGGQVQYHGVDARLELGTRRIFVVHYPEYGYAMACTGDWDLICCGHSHKAGVQQVRNVKAGEPGHGGRTCGACYVDAWRSRHDALRDACVVPYHCITLFLCGLSDSRS
jgi:uncharacterized protein